MTDDTPKRRFGWMSILLVLSLAANLFFVGLTFGGALHKKRGSDGPARGGDRDARIVRMFEKALPASRADDISDLRETLRSMSRPLREGRRAGVQMMLDVLSAETFDRDAFAAAQSGMQDARIAGRAKRNAIVADFFAKLDQDERLAIAESFQKRMEQRRKRRDSDN